MVTLPEWESPRRRCRKLAKRGKAPSQALLVPLVHTIASQIEGMAVQEFLTDATKMSKCLTSLQLAIQVDAIICFVDAGSEAEAVGAQLDWDSYPPKIATKPRQLMPENIPDLLRMHARIQTGVEVLKRLGATIMDESLFAVVITGPATLATQIGEGSDGEILEQCGRIVSETGRIFGEAGAHLIMITEEVPPKVDYQDWQAVLLPVINVARFYNALPVLVPKGMTDEQMQKLVNEVPDNILMCTDIPITDSNPVGQLLIGQPDEWKLSTNPVSLLTTAGEISPDGDIPELRTSCQRIRNELAKARNCKIDLKH